MVITSQLIAFVLGAIAGWYLRGLAEKFKHKDSKER